MSEAEFMVFENIVKALEILILAGGMAYLFYPFMIRKRESGRSRQKKVLIVFVTYSLIYFTAMMSPIWNWLCMLLILAVLAAASGFLEMDRKICSLLVVLFYFLWDMSWIMSESLYYIFAEQFVWNETDIEVIYRNGAVGYSAERLLIYGILAVMICFLHKKMPRNKFEPSVKEFCYLSIIPVVGVLFANVISRTFVLMQGHEIFRLFEQYPVFLGIVPLIAILFYAGSLFIFISHQEMITLQEEKKQYFVEEQQLQALQEHIREVEQFYAGIRQIKHEMRNHLMTIKGLAENGRYEDMEQYIAKMDDSMSAFELTVKTGNAVTDVIVNDKKKAADKLGVKFQTEFTYPRSDKYNSYDVGIILNNLLTNALEACEKMDGEERYIILSGKQKRKFFLIEVKNSFEGEIEFDKKMDLPVSTKQNDNAIHGIGLSNVKREVDKYMGDVKIKVKKNEFSVTILLQERGTENEY